MLKELNQSYLSLFTKVPDEMLCLNSNTNHKLHWISAYMSELGCLHPDFVRTNLY